MQVHYDIDELYPWYNFQTSDKWSMGTVEVSEEEWEEYCEAKNRFFELHADLVERADR